MARLGDHQRPTPAAPLAGCPLQAPLPLPGSRAAAHLDLAGQLQQEGGARRDAGAIQWQPVQAVCGQGDEAGG